MISRLSRQVKHARIPRLALSHQGKAPGGTHEQPATATELRTAGRRRLTQHQHIVELDIARTSYDAACGPCWGAATTSLPTLAGPGCAASPAARRAGRLRGRPRVLRPPVQRPRAPAPAVGRGTAPRHPRPAVVDRAHGAGLASATAVDRYGWPLPVAGQRFRTGGGPHRAGRGRRAGRASSAPRALVRTSTRRAPTSGSACPAATPSTARRAARRAALPVAAADLRAGGRLSMRYGRPAIEAAHARPGVPPLDRADVELFDLIDEIASDQRHRVDGVSLEAGRDRAGRQLLDAARLESDRANTVAAPRLGLGCPAGRYLPRLHLGLARIRRRRRSRRSGFPQRDRPSERGTASGRLATAI